MLQPNVACIYASICVPNTYTHMRRLMFEWWTRTAQYDELNKIESKFEQ